MGSNQVSSERATTRSATSRTPADPGTRRMVSVRRCPGGSVVAAVGEQQGHRVPALVDLHGGALGWDVAAVAGGEGNGLDEANDVPGQPRLGRPVS
jgi:hypothetical protein